MNREIKFRAWDRIDYMSKPFTVNDLQNNRIRFTSDCYVMQFTGLHDKNGKEIYEGDIVSFMDDETIPNQKQQRSVQVFWWNEFSKFDLKNTHKELNFLTQDEFEIIGNIHQHRELLK